MYRILIGNSMKPTKGMISIVNIKKQSEYHTGDIIAFKGNNGLKYCHRIIKIDNLVFTTKGDNRSSSKVFEIDVPISNIIGKDCS